VNAIEALKAGFWDVTALQDLTSKPEPVAH
jgi:hypothetical protein